MAKKNVRDDPQKTQVTENPQMSDIVLDIDKKELPMQADAENNKNGNNITTCHFGHIAIFRNNIATFTTFTRQSINF